MWELTPPMSGGIGGVSSCGMLANRFRSKALVIGRYSEHLRYVKLIAYVMMRF